MIRRVMMASVWTALGFGIFAVPASAQVFGVFTWQMQPYCNNVTLTLTSVSGNFTLDGFDDQCGGAKRSAASGMGVFNPDGTVSVNFTIVPPAGQPLHVAASVSPANGQGTWTDDQGHGGTFAFFGATPGLPPLPTTPARFRVTGLNSLAQSGVTTINTWTTVEYNDGGGTFTPATGVYVVPSTGTYILTTTVRWNAFAAATGYKCIYFYQGNTGFATACEAPSTTANFQYQVLTTTARLNAGAQVTVRAFQTTGGAATIGPGTTTEATFTVTRIP